ncbi:MAG: hypothetical protein VYC39_01320 [Myxococcota bacterium]|nr:hypothetical protein [Myxococcota bacterium]
MVERSPEEQKKAVCTSLVSVLRDSEISDEIDVKQFYGMISEKYSLLVRTDVFDFQPIWSALSNQFAPEDLYGIFLRFGQVTRELGLNVRQPSEIDRLPANSKAAYLADFEEQSSSRKAPLAAPGRSASPHLAGIGKPVGTAIPTGIGTPVGKLPAGIGTSVSGGRMGSDPKVAGIGRPVEDSVNTNDAPVSTTEDRQTSQEELSNRISWAFAQSLKGAFGGELHTGEVQFLITKNFDSMMQEQRFVIDSILPQLLQLSGNSPESLYIGLASFKPVLDSMNIAFQIPSLGLSEEKQIEILERAKEQNTDNFRAGGIQADPSQIAPLPGSVSQENTQTTNKKESQLAEYNLAGQSEMSARGKLLKRVFVLLLLLGLGVTSWLVQPSRNLSVERYGTVFPIREAKSHNGIFVGYLDDAKWERLTQTERQVAVRKLQELLKKDGFLVADSKCQSMCRQVAIMNNDDKMVVFDITGAKLKAVTPK